MIYLLFSFFFFLFHSSNLRIVSTGKFKDTLENISSKMDPSAIESIAPKSSILFSHCQTFSNWPRRDNRLIVSVIGMTGLITRGGSTYSAGITSMLNVEGSRSLNLDPFHDYPRSKNRAKMLVLRFLQHTREYTRSSPRIENLGQLYNHLNLSPPQREVLPVR